MFITVIQSTNIHFFQRMEEGIPQKDPSIIDPIFFKCRLVTNAEDVEKSIPFLAQIFPFLSVVDFEKFQTFILPALILHAAPHQEQALCLLVADWYFMQIDMGNAWEFSNNAMQWYARGIQKDPFSRDCSLASIHQKASRIFLRLIDFVLLQNEQFKKTLIFLRKVASNDFYAFNAFKSHIDHIAAKQRFCYTEEDFKIIMAFYHQASSVLNELPVQMEICFQDSMDSVAIGLNSACCLSDKYPTQRHHEALVTYRGLFPALLMEEQTVVSVRKFQETIAEAFRGLFSLLIEDAFALIGPPPSRYEDLKHTPPCTFDFRAMGSIGREEGSPYSDLEFMILIRDASACEYFSKIVQVLEIQVASLGESCADNPGFHIDCSPSKHSSLIQTPCDMADLQSCKIDDPGNVENTVLKTRSLFQNDPNLFMTYEQALQSHLEKRREERALCFFKKRYADFHNNWKKPFNTQTDIIDVKKDYVEVLHHLLGDMALFCGLAETNTLDVIDALTLKKNLFSQQSTDLLKECVASIYIMRTRLHLHYKKQREEASCTFQTSFAQLKPAEINLLEKCYWLVLCPLYYCLQRIFKGEHFYDVFHHLELAEIATQTKQLILTDHFFEVTLENPLQEKTKIFTPKKKYNFIQSEVKAASIGPLPGFYAAAFCQTCQKDEWKYLEGQTFHIHDVNQTIQDCACSSCHGPFAKVNKISLSECTFEKSMRLKQTHENVLKTFFIKKGQAYVFENFYRIEYLMIQIRR